jgi:predicted dehydrogenase
VEFRRPYLIDMAGRGVAVLCEKPFTMSSEEHRDILGRFPPHRLGCGYMRRFYQSTHTLRWIMDQGWFGPLRRLKYSEGARSRGSGAEGSFLDDTAHQRSRGVLMDLGSHGLDTILNLVRPLSVTIRESEVTLDGAIDRKVTATIELRTAGSGGPVCAEFCVSWLDQQSNLIELHFRDAVVWCGIGPDNDVYVGEPGSKSRSARLTAPVAGARNPNQAFFLEWDAFLQGAISGQESAISAASALRTTELVESIHEFGRHPDG